MYVYRQSETAQETGSTPLYTVGYYDPDGKWNPESDHGGEKGQEDAANRVAFLNGQPPPRRPGRTKDGHLVQRIIRVLNKKEWSSNTTEEIVAEIRGAGYRILDLP
jgi:hypothetical protein